MTSTYNKGDTNIIRVAIIMFTIYPYGIPLYNRLNDYDNIQFKFFFENIRTKRRVWEVNKDLINFDFKMLNSIPINSKKEKFISLNIISELVKFNPDIIISYGFGLTNFQSLLYSIIQRKKFIIWGEMPLQIEKKRSKLREIYRKFFVKNCHAGLASSTQTLKYFEYLNIKRRFLALLTVDKLDNITISGNKYKNKESWNLLYVGTIEHRKGIDLLLKTIEIVQRRISEKVTIRLVGNPFGDINFVKKMQEYRHNTGIQFIEFTNNISKYYREADLFLLFTRRDAHAIVIPEAMSHGLPIICSRYAGCVDDFIEDNGKIIDPHDIEKNADLIIGLMRNPLKLAAMSQRSLKIIEKKNNAHSAESIVRMIKQL